MADLIFNESQRRAIAHGNGPALVLAGPGSGKTAVITARISTLLGQMHIRPNEILVLTFTRAAAKEMQERFFAGQNATEEREGVTFGTFHALFWKILRQACHLNASNLLTEWEQNLIVRRCIKRPVTEEELSDYVALIGRFTLASSPEQSMMLEQIPELFELKTAYGRAKKEQKKLDYEDMAELCRNALMESQSVRAFWQKKYRYILIDEFQDINQAQYNVIRILAGHEANLFAVGDDDQSIYGFRGANPGFLRRFSEDYPDCARYTLDVNYRCCASIVKAAGNLIGHNRLRLDKCIRSGSGLEGCVELMRAADEWEERCAMAAICRETFSEKPAQSIAILTRTRMELDEIAEYLSGKGIRVRWDKKTTSWKAHPAAMDIAAYVALALGPIRRSDLLRVMNRPLRKLDRNLLLTETLTWQDLYRAFPWERETIRQFEHQMFVLKSLSPDLVLPYLLHVTGYEAEQADDVITEIATCAKQAKSLSGFLDLLREPEADSGQDETYRSENRQMPEDRVVLATYHGAKGLEFDTVLLPSLVEGFAPHSRAATDEQIEEERRMFYVACTRAKKRLVLFAPRLIHRKYRHHSRFLKELVEPVK